MSFSFRLRRPLNSRTSTSSMLIDGEPLTVNLRRNQQARRLILRLDKCGDAVNVTVPEFASFQAAMEFAAEHASWIKQQRSKRRPAIPFSCGKTIPLRGEDHLIVHQPQRRGTVQVMSETRELHVAGGAEHLARRLKDWLKRQARNDLEKVSHAYGNAMGLKFSRITVRDQTSRWGSCSANGTLSYSWRLVLAPPDILDYVAAHEVAHLEEMNHSKAFWRLVEWHCPHTRHARKWLKDHGAKLHRYGA